MRKQRNGRTRDEVLLDFEIACPTPSMADVRRWQAEHPAYKWAILRSAAITSRRLLSGGEGGEPHLSPEDEALVAELVDSHMAPRRHAAAASSLAAHLERVGQSLEDVEAAIDIRPGILKSVLTDGLAGPVPKPVAREVAAQLRISQEAAAESLLLVPPTAAWSHANSRSAAPRRLRTFAEAILSSDMSDERKAFWLGEE